MHQSVSPAADADPAPYLRPGRFVDCDAAAVRRFAEAAAARTDRRSPAAVAVALFEAVRDGLRYDPYGISFDEEDYRASRIAGREAGFCVSKAILLAAAARAAGIPAAVGFADVRNHLNSPKLAELMGTDVFIFHGYAALWLDGRWVKATPAFNRELCERFDVRPLHFDGRNDALFHDFDARGRRHMEYVADRGMFVEPPVGDILEALRRTYPKLVRHLAGAGEAAADDVFRNAGRPA